MEVGSLLSVSEVAQELGVNRQKVLAFIGEGRLPAAKFGTDWRVSVVDLNRFAQVERRPGRPLSAAAAWRLLRRAEEDGRVHLRRSRVELDGFQLAHLLRRRATIHRLHTLDALTAKVAAELVAGGELAARLHGFAPHSATYATDGYLRQSALASHVDRHAMTPAIGEDVNVRLRVVDDAVWPFEAGTATVSPLVAAIDMIGDPIDDRSIDAAMPIVEKYL